MIHLKDYYFYITPYIICTELITHFSCKQKKKIVYFHDIGLALQIFQNNRLNIYLIPFFLNIFT